MFQAEIVVGERRVFLRNLTVKTSILKYKIEPKKIDMREKRVEI